MTGFKTPEERAAFEDAWDAGATPPAQAMTAEAEWIKHEKIRLCDKWRIPRTGVSATDLEAVLSAAWAAARQSWEAERANLEITAASCAAKLLSMEAERAEQGRDHNSEGWNKALDVAAKYLEQREDGAGTVLDVRRRRKACAMTTEPGDEEVWPVWLAIEQLCAPPAPASPPERCLTCGGVGYVPCTWYTGPDAERGWDKCPDCAGTGQRKEKADERSEC